MESQRMQGASAHWLCERCIISNSVPKTEIFSRSDKRTGKMDQKVRASRSHKRSREKTLPGSVNASSCTGDCSRVMVENACG